MATSKARGCRISHARTMVDALSGRRHNASARMGIFRHAHPRYSSVCPASGLVRRCGADPVTPDAARRMVRGTSSHERGRTQACPIGVYAETGCSHFRKSATARCVTSRNTAACSFLKSISLRCMNMDRRICGASHHSRNSLTNASAGALRISAGAAYCAIRPPFKSATLSASAKASSRSCVTNKVVTPSRS